MHIEKITYYDPIQQKWLEYEVTTFDTIVHMNKGRKHVLRDIERLLNEDAEGKLKPQPLVTRNRVI